jgi:hypothetical protein
MVEMGTGAPGGAGRSRPWIGMGVRLFGLLGLVGFLSCGPSPANKAAGAPPGSTSVLSASPGPVRPAPDLDARFAFSGGWLGADGIYSVALPDGRQAWLFSDTWIGVIKNGRRDAEGMVNNSIGITRGPGTARFTYRREGDLIRALFVPPDGHGWYWLWAGVVDAGRLFLFATRVESAEGPEGFGFRHFGTAMGEVENLSDEPSAWRVRWRDVPASWAPRVFWGSAALAHGDFVYVYGFIENGQKGLGFRRDMLVARAPSGHLADLTAWRFFDGAGWQADIRQAAPACPDISTEYSVTWIPARGRFLLVNQDVFLSPTIVARTADHPWGPWSDKIEVYTCPEAAAKPNVFCYAGKHQPVYSDDRTLVLSYATNGDMSAVAGDPSLYVPRFIRVPIDRIFRPAGR